GWNGLVWRLRSSVFPAGLQHSNEDDGFPRQITHSVLGNRCIKTAPGRGGFLCSLGGAVVAITPPGRTIHQGGVMNKMGRGRGNVLVFIVVLAVTVTVVQGQTYTALYSFGTNAGDPKNPATNGLMSQGRDGNLYSTTNAGGASNLGAAFNV